MKREKEIERIAEMYDIRVEDVKKVLAEGFTLEEAEEIIADGDWQ